MKKIEHMLKLADIMAIFGVSKKTAMRYVAHLPRVEIGKSVYYPESVIRDFIETHTTDGGERNETKE